MRDNFLATGDDQGDVKVGEWVAITPQQINQWLTWHAIIVDMDNNKIYKKLVKKHNSVSEMTFIHAK